jgi:type I restriction enzyme M protein
VQLFGPTPAKASIPNPKENMDTSELSGLLKRLCKVAWAANVTNPITYVTQISYLLFLKMLEEWDAQAEQDARDLGREHHSLFETVEINGEPIEYGALCWSRFSSDPDNDRMLRTVRDLLPKLAEHPQLSQGARQVFTGAALVIPDGASLRRIVDLISPVSFMAEDADMKGDLFEILVDDLGSQKRAAQFRTPRHLIRVITQMVDPRIGETVCDPAAGTGGFLMAAYEHIRTVNSSPEFIRETQRNSGPSVRRGLGDKLSPAQREFLDSGALHAFESDQDIIRMVGMNAVLHGFDRSPIIRRDSIAGSEDRWDETQFDVILTNPPFSGEVDRNSVKRSLRADTGTKYLLFLALCLRSLRMGGRCGIILPNGALFGDTGAHAEIKRKLLDEFELQAVVALPIGMFQPYTGIPTAFLNLCENGQADGQRVVLQSRWRWLIAERPAQVWPAVSQRLSRPAGEVADPRRRTGARVACVCGNDQSQRHESHAVRLRRDRIQNNRASTARRNFGARGRARDVHCRVDCGDAGVVGEG